MNTTKTERRPEPLTTRAARDSTIRAPRVRLDSVSLGRVTALQGYLDAHLDKPPSLSVTIRWAIRFAADTVLGDPEARAKAQLQALPEGGKSVLQFLIDVAAAGE